MEYYIYSSTSRQKKIDYLSYRLRQYNKMFSIELNFNVEEFKNPFITPHYIVNKLLSKQDLCNVRYMIYSQQCKALE